MAEHLSFLEEELVGLPDTPAAFKPSQSQQVSALTRLSWISAAMGPVDTRVLLLPFLQSYQLSRRESDEILCVLAAQWRAVARGVVGVLKADEEERERRLSLLGSADASARRDESAAVTRALGEIAGALEPLAAKEEKCIRDEAVTSLLYLLRFFPDFRSQQAFAQRFLLPIASRLLHSDSGLFFSKCSAAKLVPALYAYAAPAAGQVDDGVEKEKTEQEEGRDQRPAASREASAPEEKRVESEDSDLRRPELNLDRSELRSLFEKLLTHEALLVRRDAAVEVPAFVRHWRRIRDQTRQSACSEDAAQTLEEDPQGLGDFFLPTLKKMIADTIDFLRAAAVGSLLQLALLFPSASSQTFSASAVFPLLSAAVSDPSWRVRAVVARGLAALTAAFPSQFASQFYPCLQPLLRDSALRDVRQAAIRAVGEIAEVLPADEVSEYLVPLVPQLLQENAMSPAAAAAGVLPVVAPPTLSSPLLCNSPLLAPVLEVALPVARAAGAASAQTVLASLALLLNSREESHVRMTYATRDSERQRPMGRRRDPERIARRKRARIRKKRS
ncbi:HEAT repeat-containing protein, partial [Toxoplasma gondii FOU]